MVEKIKIDSIKLENYRQYFGTCNIRFSNRDEGFSVIVGENGAGKSNLLNAINWCFYQKEPHTNKNKGYGIMNEKYLESIKNGNIANMVVQVEIQKGKDKYRISRILKVIKNEYQYEEINTETKIVKMTNVHGYPLPTGCEVIENQSTFEILIKKEHEHDFHPNRETSSDMIMNEILPESLSAYFILDGEFLEKFWSGIQKVQKGIEHISQLYLLNSATEHLKTFEKNVPVIGDSDIDNLSTKIRQNDYYENSQDVHGVEAFSAESRYAYDSKNDEYEFYHATGKPRIKDIKDDIEKMKKEVSCISEQFGASNIETVKSLNELQKQLHEEYANLSEQTEQAEKAYFGSLIENMPLLFLKSSVEDSIQLVDDLRAKGELPYEAKKIFTNDLLERGTCICHTDLKSHKVDEVETNQARINVTKVRDSMAQDQGLDGSVAMKYHFEEMILGDFDKFTSTSFDLPRKKYSNTKNQKDKCNKSLKEINTKLRNLGHVNVQELAKNQEYILDLIQEKTKEIKDIERRIEDNQRDNNHLKLERKNLLGKNKKSLKIKHEQDAWSIILQIMQNSYDELKHEIREQVQDKTMEIFLNTMYKENLFKKFVIKKDFGVELIDKKDQAILGSLSAGESLFLALSFISAIRDVTGYRFPLVIDTPLGRVSGTPRYLLSQALPKYLPNEQIIFLATDTEFLSPDINTHEKEGRPGMPFGQLLEDQTKVNYYLIKGMDENAAKIVDYIPRWRVI